MRLLSLLLLTLFSLQASNILSYKIYERSDRTDILLTFDTPFDGRISQQKDETTTTLSLYGANYGAPMKKELGTAYLNSFSIMPQTNRTALVFTMPQQIQMNVSKTVDNYGLRLRFFQNTPNKQINSSALAPAAKTTEAKLPTKQESLVNGRYIIVIAILFIAVILLFIIKKRYEKSAGTGSWLFKDKKEMTTHFNILFQRPIDNVNKVVLLEVGSRQYLVVIGNSHLLLDTFSEDASQLDESGFESMLKKNKQELDAYMKIDQHKPHDPLQNYKEKASLEAYRSQMDD